MAKKTNTGAPKLWISEATLEQILNYTAYPFQIGQETHLKNSNHQQNYTYKEKDPRNKRFLNDQKAENPISINTCFSLLTFR